MGAKPLIGVNISCPADRRGRRPFCDALLPQWLDCVAQTGGIPILIPPIRDGADLERALEPLDGFVYAGPADADLWLDVEAGEDPSASEKFGLLRVITEQRVPFLGIGSGLQLLNAALGGSFVALTQLAAGRSAHVHPHNPRHPLVTSPGSVMERVFGPRIDPVGSAHAVAVDELAIGLRATAWSEDGVIEAVENETPDWFALGVQFLPPPDPLENADLRLFAVLIEQAAAGRNEPLARRGAASVSQSLTHSRDAFWGPTLGHWCD